MGQQLPLSVMPRYSPAVYWLVLYDVVDDYVRRREPFRPQHLHHVQEAHDKGLLVMGGAYADPVDGAAIVFKTDDRSEVERWVHQDPYVVNGLIPAWRAKRWSIGIGAP